MAEVHPPASKPISSNTEPDEQIREAAADGEQELVGANKVADTNLQKSTSHSTKATNDDPTTSNTAMKTHLSKTSDEKSHDDHTGEELVEGQEDDVIY